MSTRLSIDAHILNDRYAQFKSKAARSASLFDVEDALDDDDDDEDDDEIITEGSSGSDSRVNYKETLFDGIYGDDQYEEEDPDYEDQLENVRDAFVKDVDQIDDDDDDFYPDKFDEDISQELYDLAEGENVGETLLKNVFRILHRIKSYWRLIGVISIMALVILTIPYLSIGIQQSSSQIIPNVKSLSDISRSIQNLQWQINDINTKNKGKIHELRSYVDHKFEEVASKFGSVDKRLDQLQRSNEQLIQRLNSLKLDSVGIDEKKIPVVLDENNNVQLLPEFQRYLQQYIQSVLEDNNKTDTQFKIDYQKFVEDYINEIVSDKIGFMSKEDILHLISSQFQDNRRKLINEIKQLTQSSRPAPNDIPTKLIPSLDKKRSKINYAQASNGARIINYLTSATFKPKTKNSLLGWIKHESTHTQQDIEDEQTITPNSPFIVLTNHEGFWKSSERDATIGIKFLEPIFINNWSYNHPRVLNSALLTSCPMAYEVFVQCDNDEMVKSELRDQRWKYTGDTTLQRGRYVKVMECEYDVNGDEIQHCDVPDVVKTSLTRSVVIRIRGNYGNEFFTSAYKWIVNGLTRFDLASVDKLLGNSEIGESLKRNFRVSTSDETVKSFGDDVVV
ncbi:CYFA0S38e00254g1_1 [Cyberlindnera fabianii]|uniref:CYFA0S38e00254g1_1 n=1 Tax=Cyberlindnera fabianii TaxID=36022 RepID=A0A061BCY7_CYBFA|nr:CYFA0S38e00254g1_1 [Cyberlindnera fabianii]